MSIKILRIFIQIQYTYIEPRNERILPMLEMEESTLSSMNSLSEK